jgi:hypothetical protein
MAVGSFCSTSGIATGDVGDQVADLLVLPVRRSGEQRRIADNKCHCQKPDQSKGWQH